MKKLGQLISRVLLAVEYQDSVTEVPEQVTLLLFPDVSLSELVFDHESYCVVSILFLFPTQTGLEVCPGQSLESRTRPGRK